MDEGSAYLGECALVPYDSPINQTGILFYNTLFDENACCHLALGMGFIDTIRDYPNRTLEEMRALGVNDSMIHEDFMIGSADLSIDAVCGHYGALPRRPHRPRVPGRDMGFLTEIPFFRRNTAKCGALRFWSAPFFFESGEFEKETVAFSRRVW